MSITGNWDGRVSRRSFVGGAAAAAAAVSVGGGLSALGARTAEGKPPERAEGYGPLVPMGDIALPRGFRYKVISRQGQPMDDGNPTPGIFDGMGAYPGPDGNTVLIRNHENRRVPGEIPVIVPEDKRYDQDPTAIGGDTKLVVDKKLNVVESFAILGGTDTNCAGGMTPWGTWITCEEVVRRSATTGTPHGYIFEIDASAEGPVEARPVLAAGRFVHEAVAFLDGILYETEDVRDDSFFYRY
ncbi:MAG: alkaline phosphatase PhoX, partial [Rubrobacteraceae bacterium]